MSPKLLRALGKTKGKVTAVFAVNALAAEAHVTYLRHNLELPVWLFSLARPEPATAALCERVIVASNAAALWWRAQRVLWPHQVALALADWGEARGHWPIKLAPLTIPFFRALFRNQTGEFFPGTPRMIALHARLELQRGARNLSLRSKELLVGAALWIFAFFAQWNSGLSRFVFRRIRGSEALSVTAESSGTEVAVHRYRGREWNADVIYELLRSTDARWLFFLKEGCVAESRELMPLFREGNTFAVSIQEAVRAWRPLLFAAAPFRALAPGEVSRVHAPVSSAMLVDTAKLRALGLPALSSFGSNWFVLFHQAAAAGWNSYSLGWTAAPANLAAVPFDEAEYVKTLLAEPGLRRLAPREPALARGNIAQSGSHGAGFRGLPRVLVVSPYLPFPLSHGGAVRMWNLCHALADRVDFVLACFLEQDEPVQYEMLHRVFREVYVVDSDEKHRDPALPEQVNGYESSSMRALVASLCHQQPIQMLQVEYTQMARYREAAPRTRALLVEHDLTFMLFRQLAEATPSPAAERAYRQWLRFERERLGAFDGVWTMSEQDRVQAVAEGAPARHTFAVPNGVDLARYRCPAAGPTSQRILYVGSFRHLPNYLAFEELHMRIMPAVWERFPNATLDVVAGPNHTRYWPGSHVTDTRIMVHGFEENLLPFYSAAAVVAVPLPVSAGTNIKLMEALACARPVVTTPVGCAGLELGDSREVLIRDLGSTFSDAICQLLADPALRLSIANNGLRSAQNRFGWNAIADTAYATYAKINPSWPPSH